MNETLLLNFLQGVASMYFYMYTHTVDFNYERAGLVWILSWCNINLGTWHCNLAMVYIYAIWLKLEYNKVPKYNKYVQTIHSFHDIFMCDILYSDIIIIITS